MILPITKSYQAFIQKGRMKTTTSDDLVVLTLVYPARGEVNLCMEVYQCHVCGKSVLRLSQSLVPIFYSLITKNNIKKKKKTSKYFICICLIFKISDIRICMMTRIVTELVKKNHMYVMSIAKS